MVVTSPSERIETRDANPAGGQEGNKGPDSHPLWVAGGWGPEAAHLPVTEATLQCPSGTRTRKVGQGQKGEAGRGGGQVVTPQGGHGSGEDPEWRAARQQETRSGSFLTALLSRRPPGDVPQGEDLRPRDEWLPRGRGRAGSGNAQLAQRGTWEVAGWLGHGRT